jgi:hypothetical protein
MSSNIVQRLLKSTGEKSVEQVKKETTNHELNRKTTHKASTRERDKGLVLSTDQAIRSHAKTLLAMDEGFSSGGKPEKKIAKRLQQEHKRKDSVRKKCSSMIVTNSRSSIVQKKIKSEPTINKKAFQRRKKRQSVSKLAKKIAKAKVPKLA